MSNEHREQARDKEAERIVRYCEHASIPFQQKMGYLLDALSSRDAEVREVLEGLSKVLTFEHGPSQRCWCSAWVHTPACLAARDLYSKLQVAELQKREGRNSSEE